MRYRPSHYQNVYLIGSGHFLPGEPVNNEEMDAFIAPINNQSQRIKRRILAENGIQQRYYAINQDGTTQFSATEMAAQSVKRCLENAGRTLNDVTLLTTGSGGGDVLMPGLANMLQGELKAPPLETHSHHGICASGVHALKDAANLIDSQSHQDALVSAMEFPSRFFKKSRFAAMNYDLDFDAHFLRWMLSDGAGACYLSSKPDERNETALKLEWIHSKSFSGDFPVCMQLGQATEGGKSFLDTASFAEAEAEGLFAVRQNIRLLPQLFEVGIHEYAALAKEGYVNPDEVDYFLCHYSSESLGVEADQLMQEAGLAIPRDKWFSNLASCGNTGSASIFIMLSEFLRKTDLKEGDTIFCFVPESGRFTVSYFMFSVVKTPEQSLPAMNNGQTIKPPHEADGSKDKYVQKTLQELATIWHDYRSQIWRTPLVKTILQGNLDLQQYREWMACWVPQVREGSKWMRVASSNLSAEFHELKAIIETHAGEEQDDYEILFDDYLAAGGEVNTIDELRRNPGGDALNAYMYSAAESVNPIGLLGAIYIIEGTGQRIVPVLLPELRKQLPLTDRGFRFLRYHSQNDMHHLTRWLNALSLALNVTDLEQRSENARAVLRAAKHVAQLYQLQWEYIL